MPQRTQDNQALIVANGRNHVTVDGPAHAELTQELFDTITRELYEAAAGAVPWLRPLNRLVDALDLWSIHFHGIDTRVGRMLFSYEAGSASPECALDYIRTYQHVDPRIALALRLPAQEWFGCHEHFDDAFVAKSPFYQDFLIPHGGRYVFGCKLVEGDAMVVSLGLLSHYGKPPLDLVQRQFAERIGNHVAGALAVQDHLRSTIERSAVGFELLSRMRQPIILVDAERHITFRNAAAQEVLERGDLLVDQAGSLICCDPGSSVEMTVTMRDLTLTQNNATLGDNPLRTDRRSVKLRRAKTRETVVVTLLALRPERTSGAFGPTPQALVTIYEPGRMAEPDPFLLAATFDLTPAESRVASRICSGATLKEISEAFNISMNTVKSQLRTVFDKTGTNRQSDLVRLLISASTF